MPATSSSPSPPPIIDSLDVEGKVHITSNTWRLWFQRLHILVNEVIGSYVTSFNGRSGAVTPLAGDYSVGQVTNAVPDSRTVNGHDLTANITVSASDITTGTLPHAQLPALVSGDIPNNAANTTGSAAKWTTSRALAGNSVDGTADVPFVNKFIVQGTADAGLTGAQFLGALITGLLKNTTTTGVLSIATANTDYLPGTNPIVTGTLTALGDIVLPKTSGFGIQVDTAAPTFPWQDLPGILRPDPIGASSPTLAAVRGGLTREFFYSANDKMDMDFHIPHDYVAGSDLFLHIHWGHNGTAISGNFVVTFTYTYAKGHNQAIFPAEKAVVMTYATVNIATTPRYIHRIDEIQLSSNGGSATLQDTALIEPDGVFLVNMTVTTIPTITGGTTNEPFVCYADMHYQSTNIGTKQKAPNFYV